MSVLIVSNESDLSTNKVFSYLSKRTKVILVRQNFHNYIDVILDDKEINGIQYVWFRREPKLSVEPEFAQSRIELFKLSEFLKLHLEKNYNYLGSLIEEERINKLMTLDIASKCKLKIPETYVAKDKSISQISSKQLITKPIGNFNKIVWKDNLYYNKANALVDSNSKTTSFPSLLQEYVDKLFEIRIFFLDHKFYSMAIFSQKNVKTKIDFRNYDLERLNRNVPFKLPQIVSKKLSRLMQLLNLNNGSIDMIYSTSSEYIFLEVNPLGQFDWLSYNCNYYIERDIAKIISNER